MNKISNSGDNTTNREITKVRSNSSVNHLEGLFTHHRDLLPRQKRINQISRKLNDDYVRQIKETELKSRRHEELYNEMNTYNKKLNEIRYNNRDEEILKMQKENQEIEDLLNELTLHHDKAELIEKKEESRKLIEELNLMFNEKKKEAAEKDEERKKAIEEIKQIKKYQEEHKDAINRLLEEKDIKTKILENLENDVEKLKIYKQFFDQVTDSSNDASNELIEKLKIKFENLIERMNEIEKDINDKEKEIKNIKKDQQEMIKINDKQFQNTRLLELEKEIKFYTDENKNLEIEIDEIMKKNQKKDLDTHQIKLTINNLYNKVHSTNEFDVNADDDSLCEKLYEINEKIIDLIKIYNELEHK